MAINNGLIYLPAWNPQKKPTTWELNLFLFYSGSFVIVVTERKKKTMAGKSSLIIGEGY